MRICASNESVFRAKLGCHRNAMLTRSLYMLLLLFVVVVPTTFICLGAQSGRRDAGASIQQIVVCRSAFECSLGLVHAQTVVPRTSYGWTMCTLEERRGLQSGEGCSAHFSTGGGRWASVRVPFERAVDGRSACKHPSCKRPAARGRERVPSSDSVSSHCAMPATQSTETNRTESDICSSSATFDRSR